MYQDHRLMAAGLNRIGALALLLGTMLGCATTPGSSTPEPATPSVSQIRPATGKVDANAEAVANNYIGLGMTERAIAEKWQGRSFEEFLESVWREPNGGKYIVNGDTPIVDIKHLREFYQEKVQKAGQPRAGLIVNQSGGVDTVWSDSEKHAITYCVSTTFGSRHAAVVSSMAASTGAWEAVADIDFIYSSSHDNNCTATNNQVVFDVRPVSNGGYLARAFFPGESRSARNVLIDDSAFQLDPNGTLTLAGIQRHELGHTLGFRHEHTRPDSGTCFEDNNWRPLTDYDEFSTMHYPQCNGGGDFSLTLTDRDKSGAACLYGAAPGFTIDTTICEPPAVVEEPCGCEAQSISESGQILKDQIVRFGPFAIKQGSKFDAVMVGTGDPDLYVRFRQEPTRTTYDCRPFLTGATETCNLTVPVGATNAFVMVYGYAAGSYQLQITHTPN